MDEQEMARVEQELGIRLPAEFRRTMESDGTMMRGLTYRRDGVEQPYFDGHLYLDPGAFIGINLGERDYNYTARGFPGWWQTFVMVGTNGGGDYYCLRLDDGPGVWMIGTDCGSKPTKTHDHLADYFRDLMSSYQAEVVTPPHAPTPNFTEEFTPKERDAHEARAFTVPEAERPFLNNIIEAPDDTLRRLVFADWLEENGQSERATFIRARCAIDDKPPDFGTYADALEQLAGYYDADERVTLPAGFTFYCYGSNLQEWGDSHDAMEGGLPSCADPEKESNDELQAAQLVAARLPAVIETTPIRGLNLTDLRGGHAAVVLTSPAAAALRRLEIECAAEGDGICPVVAALVASPVARNLTRLEIHNGVPNNATVNALAAAPFDRLLRYDAAGYCGPTAAIDRLRSAPWFRRLQRLGTAVPPGVSGPYTMPDLHTLCLWIPDDDTIEPFGQNAALPSLRRLLIHAANLRGKRAKALAGLKCGELVELWVRNSAVRPADMAVLLAAPWAKRLEVLTFEHDEIDPGIQAAIDESPCAKTLRIVRLK